MVLLLAYERAGVYVGIWCSFCYAFPQATKHFAEIRKNTEETIQIALGKKKQKLDYTNVARTPRKKNIYRAGSCVTLHYKNYQVDQVK